MFLICVCPSCEKYLIDERWIIPDEQSLKRLKTWKFKWIKYLKLCPDCGGKKWKNGSGGFTLFCWFLSLSLAKNARAWNKKWQPCSLKNMAPVQETFMQCISSKRTGEFLQPFRVQEENMKKRRPYKHSENDSLEFYMENWKEHCEVCHEPLLVHSFRRGSPRWRKAVYSACHNKSCRNQFVVICVYLEERNDLRTVVASPDGVNNHRYMPLSQIRANDQPWTPANLEPNGLPGIRETRQSGTHHLPRRRLCLRKGAKVKTPIHFCAVCHKFKAFGKWHKITDEIAVMLKTRRLEWEPKFITCPSCKSPK